MNAVEHAGEDVADDLLDERFLLVRENAETARLFQLGKSLHDSVVGTGRIAAALCIAVVVLFESARHRFVVNG